MQKYKEGTPYLVLKSLTYFDDAESDDIPKMFKKIDWEKVKEEITAAVKDYLNQN